MWEQAQEDAGEILAWIRTASGPMPPIGDIERRLSAQDQLVFDQLC